MFENAASSLSEIGTIEECRSALEREDWSEETLEYIASVLCPLFREIERMQAKLLGITGASARISWRGHIELTLKFPMRGAEAEF